MGRTTVWTAMVGCRGQLASWRRVTPAVARAQRKVQSWGMGDGEGPEEWGLGRRPRCALRSRGERKPQELSQQRGLTGLAAELN